MSVILLHFLIFVTNLKPCHDLKLQKLYPDQNFIGTAELSVFCLPSGKQTNKNNQADVTLSLHPVLA